MDYSTNVLQLIALQNRRTANAINTVKSKLKAHFFHQVYYSYYTRFSSAIYRLALETGALYICFWIKFIDHINVCYFLSLDNKQSFNFVRLIKIITQIANYVCVIYR